MSKIITTAFPGPKETNEQSCSCLSQINLQLDQQHNQKVHLLDIVEIKVEGGSIFTPGQMRYQYGKETGTIQFAFCPFCGILYQTPEVIEKVKQEEQSLLQKFKEANPQLPETTQLLENLPVEWVPDKTYANLIGKVDREGVRIIQILEMTPDKGEEGQRTVMCRYFTSYQKFKDNQAQYSYTFPLSSDQIQSLIAGQKNE